MKYNRSLADLEAMSTKANTEFQAWWKLLNAELARAKLAAAEYGEARGCYEMGECPETASAALQATR